MSDERRNGETYSLPQPPEREGFKPNSLKIELLPIAQLKFPKRILKTKAEKRIEAHKRFQEHEGYSLPVPIDPMNNIILGEERVEAARRLGHTHIAVVRVSDITKDAIRKLRLLEAKLSTEGELDRKQVRDTFLEVLDSEADYNLEILGFSTAEIDLTLEFTEQPEENAETEQLNAEDVALPEPCKDPVSRIGDIWTANGHRFICGDATLPETYERLLQGETAKATVTDPPYGVKIQGHVSGLGKNKHREFVQGSDKVTKKELKNLLKKSIRQFLKNSQDGALIYLWMDWRGIELLLSICRKLGLTLINLCVWGKTSPSMGSYYRSQQELCAVLRVGKASHQNNIELGVHGRSRSNLWSVPGMNSFGRERDELLASHPTPKPCILFEDIIKDCTSRNDIILDGFLGSGTTLIAAEKTGRKARVIELDPIYVDVAVRRFQKRFGVEMLHELSGKTFSEIERERSSETPGDTAMQTEAPVKASGRIRTRKSLNSSNNIGKGTGDEQ